MNAVTTTERGALALSEPELLEVLGSSLYPGAKPASIKLVLGYCKAANLDPMQKPVHLVPMTVKTGELDGYGNAKKEKRDVVMPGIGLYRTQAARTGQYGGQDRPVYGDEMELTYNKKITEWVDVPGKDKRQPKTHWEEQKLDYPEWCEVTVYRFVCGQRVAFTAQEYWIENYATAGTDTDAPNEMWERRTRGQLKKCAEAQALRMAFPDAVGAQPTADEMEGKSIDGEVIDAGTGEIVESKRPAPPTWPDEAFKTQLVRWEKAVRSRLKTTDDILALARSKGALTPEQERQIRGIKEPTTEAEAGSAADAIEKVLEKDVVDPFVAEMDAAEKRSES